MSKLTIDHLEITLNGYPSIIFSFHGQIDTLKKIVRELLWGGILSTGQYEVLDYFDLLHVQYNVIIDGDNFDDLTRMFFYMEKRLGFSYFNEHAFLENFKTAKEFINYKKEGVEFSAPISYILHAAIIAAEAKKEKELIIIENEKPDDWTLWTKDELQNDEDTALQLKKKFKLDKQVQTGFNLTKLSTDVQFKERETFYSLLKKVKHLEFFQRDLISFKTCFIDILKKHIVTNQFNIKKILEPEDHQRLLLLAILLVNRDNEQDTPLIFRILDHLIINNYYPAILLRIEAASNGRIRDGENPMHLTIDLLKRASEIGDAKATGCLAKLCMGIVGIDEYFNCHSSNLLESEAANLKIDMKQAIRYLNTSEKQGLKTAYLNAAYDLAQLDLAPMRWQYEDIQLAMKVMEKGSRLPCEEPLKRKITMKLEQLQKQYPVKIHRKELPRSYFNMALVFWEHKNTLATKKEEFIACSIN